MISLIFNVTNVIDKSEKKYDKNQDGNTGVLT